LWGAAGRNDRVRKEITEEVKEEENGKEYGALDEKI
jgi:hypothetical protein